MNKIITGACIVLACCFSACANTDDQDDASILTNMDSSKPATIITDSQNLVKPTTLLPASGPEMTQPVINSGSLSTTVAAGMNPAHGLPNHRCDIAVGAPLNSSPTKPGANPLPAANSPVIQTTPAPAQMTKATTITPKGMNPQHGEPGHRCDIAVGAPLNSPVTKQPTQTLTPVSVPAPVIAPPKKDSGS